jgi:hypothetical protein
MSKARESKRYSPDNYDTSAKKSYNNQEESSAGAAEEVGIDS